MTFLKRKAEPVGISVYYAKRRTWKIIWSFIRTVFILGFSFVILFPLINMLSRSFMAPEDLYDSSVLWIPANFTLENFRVALNGLEYGRSFFNSLWSSAAATVFQAASCTLAGYALARYNFPGNRFVFKLVIFTLIVPPQLTMVSSYMYFNNLKLLDTELPILLMSLTGNGIRAGLFIYLVRQSFMGFPKAVEEAAMVDGAGHFRTFFSIMLPGAVNVLVTVVLFSFVWYWNDVFYVNLYNREFWSLSNSMNMANFNFSSGAIYQGFSQYDPVLTQNFKNVALLLIVGPLIVLFLILQRYFVESVERSGLVG